MRISIESQGIAAAVAVNRIEKELNKNNKYICVMLNNMPFHYNILLFILLKVERSVEC